MTLADYLNDYGDHIAIVAAAVYLLGLIAAYMRRRYRHKRAMRLQSASALLAYYSFESQMVQLAEGTVAGMHYVALKATSSKAMIYRVELPFASKLHLLGVPLHSDVKQINPTGRGSIFEVVNLEGDYGNYFRLYCQLGQQVKARYALDPKAMAFTVDFCQSHSWEIVGSELYFVQTGRRQPGDSTNMHDDIEAFVANIRPAVERPLTDQELRNITPYGRDRRQGLKCPVCQQVMLNEDTHYRCADHHGVLLMGRHLGELRDGTLTIEAQDSKATADRGSIECPSCGKMMTQVNYGSSRAVIDSCSGCPYRWLDSADLL